MKKLLVALDLSDIDKSLLKFTQYLTSILPVEKVFFVHNIKKHEITDLFKEQLQDIDIEQIISDELDEFIGNNFNSDVEIETMISVDLYTESLISYIVNKYSIDTVILGNKNSNQSTGVLPSKLVRLLKSQILWVPELKNFKINKIWIGTDFSNSSLRAFEMGYSIQKKSNATLEGVHIYNLPLHFSPYLPTDKIKVKVQEATKKRSARFKKKLNKSTKINLVAGRDANIGSVMGDMIKSEDVDLLIVSDKGNSSFSPFFVGSVTEELMNQNINIPIIIVKKHPNF
ncbi:MAG: universal stress protein [Psychroflexus sp.]|nr:universal stress protein [Psychroflexus sp.]